MQQRRCMAVGRFRLLPPLPQIERRSSWNLPIRVRESLKRTLPGSSIPSSPPKKWEREPDWASPPPTVLLRITEVRSMQGVQGGEGRPLRLNFPFTKGFNPSWRNSQSIRRGENEFSPTNKSKREFIPIGGRSGQW